MSAGSPVRCQSRLSLPYHLLITINSWRTSESVTQMLYKKCMQKRWLFKNSRSDRVNFQPDRSLQRGSAIFSTTAAFWEDSWKPPWRPYPKFRIFIWMIFWGRRRSTPEHIWERTSVTLATIFKLSGIGYGSAGFLSGNWLWLFAKFLKNISGQWYKKISSQFLTG